MTDQVVEISSARSDASLGQLHTSGSPNTQPHPSDARFFPSKKPVPEVTTTKTVYRMSSPLPPISLTESAASHLRSAILLGNLSPGDLLAESAVANRLGVSRVPVREALFQLEREGLVEFSQTGRAYVKSLSAGDFEELHLLRLTLEPAAAKLASKNIRAFEDRLRENIERTRRATSLAQLTSLDLDFHQLILDASGNRRLSALWRGLRHELELWLGQLHRSHQLQTKGTRSETVRSHEHLVHAFTTGTADQCEVEMRRHVLGWREWLPTPEKP